MSYEDLQLTEREGGVRLAVRVRPRSSRSEVIGVREGTLDVAVLAPPVDGAANDELCRVLAEALGVRRRDVKVLSGASGRKKVVELSGTSAASVRDHLRRADG